MTGIFWGGRIGPRSKVEGERFPWGENALAAGRV